MISLWPIVIMAALATANAEMDSSTSVVDSTGAEVPTYTMPTIRTVAPRVVPVFPGTRTVLDRAWLEFRDPSDLAEAMIPVAGIRVLTAGEN